VIDANFLGTERDARRMLQGVRLARAIARNAAFAPFTAGELIPGDAVGDDALIPTMLGAAAANLFLGQSLVPPLVPLLVAVTVAWARRDQLQGLFAPYA
jgi:hypothetical protein